MMLTLFDKRLVFNAAVALVAAALGLVAATPAAAQLAPDDKPQVRIEARILEWQMTNSLEFDFAVRYQREPGAGGILRSTDLTLPADPSLGSAARLFFDDLDAGNGSFDAVIETLETAGDVEILAEPNIILASQDLDESSINSRNSTVSDPNKPSASYDATVTNNVQIPYESAAASGNTLISFTEYKDSGLTLNVSVLRVEEDLVWIDMRTNVSELTGFISVGLNSRNEPMSVPTIDTRLIQNRLIIPDRTVFLAGLMKTTRQSERSRGVPWLGELPIINWVLSNRRNESEDIELVFLVKPEILTTRPSLRHYATANETQ